MSNADDILTRPAQTTSVANESYNSMQQFTDKLKDNPELNRIFMDAAKMLKASSVSMGTAIDVSDNDRREAISNVAYGIVERIGELFSSKRGR